jgi:hypothetical protein
MQKRFLAMTLAAMLLGTGLSVPLGNWVGEHTTPAYAVPPKGTACNGGLLEVSVTPGTGLDANNDGIICAKDNPTPRKK